LYHVPERRELQDVVTCIREHVTLDEAGYRLETNAERFLKSPEHMAKLFHGAPEAIAETIRFANRISFRLDDLKYNYPDEPIPKGKTSHDYLSELAWDGLRKMRNGYLSDDDKAILEKELALIA